MHCVLDFPEKVCQNFYCNHIQFLRGQESHHHIVAVCSLLIPHRLNSEISAQKHSLAHFHGAGTSLKKHMACKCGYILDTNSAVVVYPGLQTGGDTNRNPSRLTLLLARHTITFPAVGLHHPRPVLVCLLRNQRRIQACSAEQGLPQKHNFFHFLQHGNKPEILK